MKKLIFILAIFFFCSNLMFPQLTGYGTSSAPYTGTIIVNTQWYPDTYPNQTIYCNNIGIASGIILTISPGAYNGGRIQFGGGRTLTINSGAVVIINPQTAVTVYRIVNNGTLRLESDESEAGVASLIHDLYSGSGTTQVEVYLSGGTSVGGEYKWHYISVPMGNINVSTFSSLDLAQYIESLVTSSDNTVGWVAWDGYQYSSEASTGYTFSTLDLCKGYNYYSSSGTTITLTGTIYIDQISEDISLTCGTGFLDFQGFNLLGNPFSSCIDWDYMVDNFYIPGTVNNAIYFTNNGIISSYVGGVGVNGGTGTIPPMQGFFVKANTNNDVVVFPSAARVHEIDQMRYKKGPIEFSKSSDTISFVRLKLENSQDSTDLVVRFNKKATISVDKMFDAHEFSKTAGDINTWTTSGSVDYSINGLPFPETSVEVSVGINVKTEGVYKLSSNELNRLENYSVTLKDLSTNTTVDLKKGDLMVFNVPAGITEDRFILTISNISTSIPEIPVIDKKFSIYSSSGMVIILSLTDDYNNIPGSVTIYDLTGRKVLQKNNVEWQSNGEIQRIALSSAEKGFFIVEIKAGNRKYVEKVHIRR